MSFSPEGKSAFLLKKTPFFLWYHHLIPNRIPHNQRLMATARPRATNPSADDGGDVDPFFSTLKSVMRISLAGFGGALAGMSLARRGASASASAIARRVANSPVVPPPGAGLPAAAADATAKTKNGGA